MGKAKAYCMDHPVIAYYSGLYGLEIHGIEYGIDDYVYCVSGAWGPPHFHGYHRVKVRYTKRDIPFIRVNGWTVYLHDCLRMEATT